MIEAPVITSSKWQREMLMDFCRQSGYSARDILSLSYLNRTFLTRNGGKYKLTSKGKIVDLEGPSSNPNERM